MAKPLVIVESPTKIKTISKYLGKDYTVVATVGHIKDLPSKEIGIDIEHHFSPNYITIPGKTKILKDIKKSAKNVKDIYLAPDPDREGEAIAWHTAEFLKKKGRKFHRVLFHELTEKAIIKAISSPKKLNKHKYKAQQTRRILDRLVGYEISPLLWKKVKRGLSAGRVQSVSVKMICEQENKINVFKSTEYWSIFANLQNHLLVPFEAKLIKKNKKKIIIPNEETVLSILEDLRTNHFVIETIKKRIKKKKPQPPFTTSRLQQESISKLNFPVKKTMFIAQQLYEGIKLGPGELTGLITYMRTDSSRISNEAAKEASLLINEVFGSDYSLKKPRLFKNRKNIQDAHEAIRPTIIKNTPEKIKQYLSQDQFKLYNLIWQKFLASQMKESLINHINIQINCGEYSFSTNESSVKFPGFTILNQPTNEKKASIEKLPDFTEGENLKLKNLSTKQHFTQPPPRFSEGSLVKELEENGIGRPSTYANILSTIRNKGYVKIEDKIFKPTELGLLVNDLLTKNFPELINVEFTAKMETKLDLIEQAKIEAKDILADFYINFSKNLIEARKNMLSLKWSGIPTNIKCPECKKNELRIKMGKNGHFIACSKYPDCTFTTNYKRNNKGKVQLEEPFKSELTDEKCDICKNFMVIKMGKYGKFLACSGYPSCKNTKSINKATSLNKIGIKCPKDKCLGSIIEKLSKRGKIFYSCNLYPKCNFASWYKPINEICPKCNTTYLIEKNTKKKGIIISCPSIECSFIKNNS